MRLTDRDHIVLLAARRYSGPFSASALSHFIYRSTDQMLSTQSVFASIDRMETRGLLASRTITLSIVDSGQKHSETVWVISGKGLNTVVRANIQLDRPC